MNDFEEGQENKNTGTDNSAVPPGKKPKGWLDALLGFGIAAAANLLIGFVTFGGSPALAITFVDFFILAVYAFLIVKFFRTGHKAAAVTMLVLIAPEVMALLFIGACGLMFSGF